MENTCLERDANKFKDSSSTIIDELVNEIEEQETVIEKLNARIEELEEEINELKTN